MPGGNRGARPASRTAGMAAAPATQSGERADCSWFMCSTGTAAARPCLRCCASASLTATILSSAHQPVARALAGSRGARGAASKPRGTAVSNSQGQDLLALNLGVPVHALPHGVWSRVLPPTATGPAVRDRVFIVGTSCATGTRPGAWPRISPPPACARSLFGAGARSNLADAANVEVSGWVPEHGLAESLPSRRRRVPAVSRGDGLGTRCSRRWPPVARSSAHACRPSSTSTLGDNLVRLIRARTTRRWSGCGGTSAIPAHARRAPGAACPGSTLRLGALAGSPMTGCSRRCRRPLRGATTQNESMGASRYNETGDGDGRLQAAYQAFEARTGRDLLRPALPKRAALNNGNRYPIVPVQLVLADQGYAALAQAVRQQALALQRLFLDLVRGDTAVLRTSACRTVPSMRNRRFRRRRA